MVKIPKGRPEFHDGEDWFGIATMNDLVSTEVTGELYILLQVIKEEILECRYI